MAQSNQALRKLPSKKQKASVNNASKKKTTERYQISAIVRFQKKINGPEFEMSSLWMITERVILFPRSTV
jgi:hypothetical protein